MPKSKVVWKKYRSFSGPVVKGLVEMDAPSPGDRTSHVARAFDLTGRVETGARHGAIMMADGTAVTAGLDQHIAVYPRALAHEDYNAKNDQGGLFKLLRRMETVDGGTIYQSQLQQVWSIFGGLLDAYVSQDGWLRYLDDATVVVGKKRIQVKAGDMVHGALIRDRLTPVGGKVPKSGEGWEIAKHVAVVVSQFMANSDGFKAQIEFGREHLVKRTKRRKINVGTKGDKSFRDLEELAYRGDVTACSLEDMDESLDLALCVYQSHSVNAPAIANKALARACARRDRRGASDGDFARHLISLLGNSTWGRWDDDIKFGRYQRTRSAALKSGLWSRSLFVGASAIMPKDLAG